MVETRVHSNDAYRLFLQAAMSRRVMSEAIAKTLWIKCYDAVERADPNKELERGDWDSFLDKIKRCLDPLDLEFARFKDEDTGKVMYTITNIKGDVVAQLASDYSPSEIAFFKAVVEQIMLAPRRAYSISSTLALREVGHLKGQKLSKVQGEVVLASLVARGWLVKSRRGRYSLGARIIMELSNYLKNTYDDVELLECVACMELVTKGYMCPTSNCNAPLHKHCYEMVHRRRNTCPKCQQDWGEDNTGLVVIGEDVVKDKDPNFEKRRVRRANGVEEDEEPEEESQETAFTQTQSQTQASQRPSRKKGKARKAGAAKVNEKQQRRPTTPDSTEEEDQLDSVYDADKPEGDDAIDIDNLAEVRERPSRRISRRE